MIRHSDLWVIERFGGRGGHCLSLPLSMLKNDRGDSPDISYKAAEIAVLIAQQPDKAVTDVAQGFKMVNNGFMDVPTIITPVVLVTKENIDSTVIDGGFYTKEQVHGK